jgi:hypothetical protein
VANKTDQPCRQCGALPTAKVVFQGVEGMILMHRLTTVKGYFCRDCGLKIRSEMDSLSMRRGWFSLGGIIGIPIFRLSNSLRAKKLLKLDAPQRATAAA